MNQGRGSIGDHNDQMIILKNIRRKRKQLLLEKLKEKLDLKVKKNKRKEVIAISNFNNNRKRNEEKKDKSNSLKQIIKIDNDLEKKPIVVKLKNSDQKEKDISNVTIKKDDLEDKNVKQPLNNNVIKEENKPAKSDDKEVINVPINETTKSTPYINKKDETDKKNTTTIGIDNNSLNKEDERVDVLTPKEELNNAAIITEINRRLYECYADLKDIEYKQKVIENKTDDVTTVKEAEELVQMINNLIKQLEEMMLEFNNLNYLFDQNYLEDLGITLVDRINNNEQIGLDRYINEYKNALDKIDKLKDSIVDLQKITEDKCDEIGLVDADFIVTKNDYDKHEKEIDELNKIIQEQNNMLKELDDNISNAVSVETKTRYVMDGVNKQSKNLIMGLTLASAIPGIGGLAIGSIVAVTTIDTINQLFNPKVHKETETEINIKNFGEEIDFIDDKISYTKERIVESIGLVTDLMNKCNAEFSSYPEYNYLKNDFSKIQMMLLEQDAELSKMQENSKKIEENNKTIVRTI